VTEEQAKGLPPDLLSHVDEEERFTDNQDIATAVLILAGAAAISIVADAIADFIYDLTATGVVVDLRDGKVLVQENSALSWRRLIVVDENGTRVVEITSREEIPPIIEAFLSGGK
jgi:hypothetical protein